MDWRHRSACLDEIPDLFFPIGHAEAALAQVEVARRICQRCEVREPCLAWALEAGLDHGVLGGMTDIERRALRRARPR
jgi:WhiB family transcriptional regulator, redox-sensing transcriptional regulator